MPLGISVAALEKQNTSLHKRTTSLKKRLDSSSWVPQELEELEQVLLEKASLFTDEAEVLRAFLLTIKSSGAHLLSWQPGEVYLYEYFAVRQLACELEGSYKQLVAILEGVCCNDLMLTKTSQGLHCRCVLELISKRLL